MISPAKEKHALGCERREALGVPGCTLGNAENRIGRTNSTAQLQGICYPDASELLLLGSKETALGLHRLSLSELGMS